MFTQADVTWPKSWSFRFGTRSVFVLMLIVALALSCIIEWRKLRDAERALTRNAWAHQAVYIPAGKFRLMVNEIMDDKDAKVFVLRFEANEQHYVSCNGSACLVESDADGVYWAEIRLVSTYDSMARHVTVISQVKSGAGAAAGRTIYPLAADVDGGKFVAFRAEPGIYDLNEAVQLGRVNDKPLILNVR
jgi:hypothetical protein